ncbi:MAG: hypothetical protein IPJ98_31265 [Bryobacterales bacterium]|nr:hypothetical protein [Bryobacterales bacterium]
MSEATARITIERRNPEDVQDRQIIVNLDGEHMSTLLYGRVVSREVAAGSHRLKAHNTLFWKNLEVELRPGEHARFEVANLPGKGTLSLLGFLGVGPLFLEFQRVAGEESGVEGGS